MLDVVLVGRPRAACNERWQGLVGTIEEESLNLGERLGLQGDVVHTVETGVAGDGASVVADAFEQFDGFLVLYEYVAVALQLLSKPFAVGLEEILRGSEDGREEIGRCGSALERLEVVEPEVVFDKEGNVGVHQLHQPSCVALGIWRQIDDDVGLIVVLPYLEAGGREECENDFVFGMQLAELLYDRSGLLEFAERRGVEPSYFGAVEFLFGEAVGPVAPAFTHQSGFFVEGCRAFYTEAVNADCQTVEESHRFLF